MVYRNTTVWILLFLVIHQVHAIPYWHDVNNFYKNGTTCPVATLEMKCPPLCVKDQSFCPTGFDNNSCPENHVICGDGGCYAGTHEDGACNGVMNLCTCYKTDQVMRPYNDLYVPCRLGKINISYFDQDKNELIASDCASRTYHVPYKKITSAKVQPTTDDAYTLVCDFPTNDISYTSAGFVSVYIIGIVFFSLLPVWAVVKSVKEQGVSEADSLRYINNRDPVDPAWTEDSNRTQNNLDLTQTGYDDHWFGIIIKIYMNLISMGWFVVFTLLTVDYYRFQHDRRPLLFNQQTVLSEAFVAVWHFCTVWFLILHSYERSITNMLRIRVPIRQAKYIEICRKTDHIVMLAHDSTVVRFLTWIRKKKEKIYGKEKFYVTVPVKTTTAGIPYFVYECIHYSYQEMSGEYERAIINLGETHEEIAANNEGLATEMAAMREQTVGPNFISVHVPSIPMAMLEEFSTAFYLYQCMMLWVWYYFAYWQVGIALTVVIVVSGFIKVFYKQQAERKIKAMAENSDACTALRDSTWQVIMTADIVPGDVLLVESGQTVACDGVMLTGSCVVDESMLTGESMPVQKIPVKHDIQVYEKHGVSKKHTLFAGTKVLQAQPYEDNVQSRVCYLAVTTGASTDKGELIQHILYPAPIFFIFDEHLKIVIMILLTWGLIAFGVVIAFMNQGNVYAWFYGIFTISQIMHPMLPAVLVIGQTVSAKRLVKQNIFCTNFQRIVMAGKIHVFCFDKTGTLTRDGLNFHGVHSIDSAKAEYVVPQIGHNNINHELQVAMATAHSLTWLDDRLVGNPVDVEMFKAVGWSLTHDSGHDTVSNQGMDEYQILKRFEFDHTRACMTSIVRNSTTGEVIVFSKGSFEKIKTMVTPQSLPIDYDQIAAGHAKQGCYTLAFARCSLGNINPELITTMERDDLEKGLCILGLILFRNLLKNDTEEALGNLKRGSVRPVMVTGDNALTAIHIASECGMFQTPGALILLGDVIDESSGMVQWTRQDNGTVVNIEDYLSSHPFVRQVPGDSSSTPNSQVDGSRVPIMDPFPPSESRGIKKKKRGKDEYAVQIDDGGVGVELAVTGKAFNILNHSGVMRKYLMHTRIFARMMPYQKVQCVNLFMELGVTGMCGDGGNDCGALRAAHVGLALSEAEASIVSPFSSNTHSIQSCVTLVSEGRAALATSFSSYKFLIMYGENLTFMSFIGAYFMVQFWWWAWVFIDAFIVIPISYALSLSRPQDTLAEYKPTARLLGAQTVVSVCAMTFFNALFQVSAVVMLFHQDWFLCHEFDGNRVDNSKWWRLADNYEGEVLAIVTIFQMISVPFALNFGAKFRRPWYTNYFFVFLFTFYFLMMSVVTLAPPNIVGCWFHINCGTSIALTDLGYHVTPWMALHDYFSADHHNVMPLSFRISLYLLCLGNIAAVWGFEYIVVLGPVRNLIRRHRRPGRSMVL